MEVENYMGGGSDMQHRDALDVVQEFSYELSKMSGKCLDIGSGPGDITKDMLLPMLGENAEIVGADVSQAMVNYARKNYCDSKRLSYMVLNIETSELPADQIGKYDNALSFYCLHWCNDLRRAFENIYKLLRPNGKALTMFIGRHGGFNAYTELQQVPKYRSYLQDAHLYVPYFQRRLCTDIRGSLREMLADIGFEILHCSTREKSYKYSQQSLKDHILAINPFLKRIPEDMKSDFINHLVYKVINKNALIPFKKNVNDHVILRYDLLIAYVQKPLLTV
ncbi:hypothetical protein PUN28_014452 [Cardiocondyla obscurior]